MRKSILILLIFIFSFLILEASQNMWVETKLNVIRNKIKEKPFREDPAMDDLLLKLQSLSPKNAKVWSVASRYYFKKMTQTSTIQERLFWIEKASHSSLKALSCDPFDPTLRMFFNKVSRWKEVLAGTLS